MTAHELLTNLQRQGFNLRPLPGDKLEVKPASRLTPELRVELKQRKPEILALLNNQPTDQPVQTSAMDEQFSSPWPCPHCGAPAEIEGVEPSRDGTRMLTFWHCGRCQVWAVTPDTLRQPPVWVSSKEQ